MEPAEGLQVFALAVYWDEASRALAIKTANYGVPDHQVLFAIETWTKAFREVMQADFFDNNGNSE